MNKLVLLGVLLSALFVTCRHVPESEDLANKDEIETLRSKHHGMSRHRRRSRQMNYGYSPYYQYDNPREYRDQYEYTQMLKLIEEIRNYISRPPTPPPPPPQPIYIPIYLPYSMPCQTDKQNNSIPDFGTRFKGDPNRIWMNNPKNVGDDEYDDSVYEKRPINLGPVTPRVPVNWPAPPVEHGTSQTDTRTTTPVPVKEPSICQAAVLTCCSTRNPKQCFDVYGCTQTYATGMACHDKTIKEVLDLFSKAYTI